MWLLLIRTNSGCLAWRSLMLCPRQRHLITVSDATKDRTGSLNSNGFLSGVPPLKVGEDVSPVLRSHRIVWLTTRHCSFSFLSLIRFLNIARFLVMSHCEFSFDYFYYSSYRRVLGCLALVGVCALVILAIKWSLNVVSVRVELRRQSDITRERWRRFALVHRSMRRWVWRIRVIGAGPLYLCSGNWTERLKVCAVSPDCFMRPFDSQECDSSWCDAHAKVVVLRFLNLNVSPSCLHVSHGFSFTALVAFSTEKTVPRTRQASVLQGVEETLD